MRKVWYHQIWIQNYLAIIVSDLNCKQQNISYVDIFEKHVCNHIVAKNRAINWATVIPGSHSVKSQKMTKFLQLFNK